MRGMTKTAEAKWRSLIAAQERSGLSVRVFAATHGIAAATLYWWRSRLSRRQSPSELVPVEIVDHDIALEPAARRTSADFEVHLDSGATLRIPTGFDAAELRRLVQALRC